MTTYSFVNQLDYSVPTPVVGINSTGPGGPNATLSLTAGNLAIGEFYNENTVNSPQGSFADSLGNVWGYQGHAYSGSGNNSLVIYTTIVTVAGTASFSAATGGIGNMPVLGVQQYAPASGTAWASSTPSVFGSNVQNGTATGANSQVAPASAVTVPSGSYMLFGFNYQVGATANNTAGTTLGFTGEGNIFATTNGGTYGLGIAEDLAITSSGGTYQVTFGTTVLKLNFTIMMAFALTAVGLPASPNTYAFSFQSATLTAGGALTLAQSPNTFAYSIQNATLASGSTLAASPLAFSYVVQATNLNFSSANYELLAAPLTYFLDLDPTVIGDLLSATPLAWAYSVQATISNQPVPYVLALTQAQATVVLNQYGFTDIQVDMAYDVVNPPGTVFAQSPIAGTIWPENAVVTIVVSEGPYVPPTQQTLPGSKVTMRAFSLEEMVSREWGSSFKAPDHRIYEFTNGRGFDSTDMGATGIYTKNIENAAIPLPPGSIMLANGDIQLPNGQIIVPGAPPPGGN